MQQVQELTNFFNRAIKEDRITVVHISCFMAIFQQWNTNHFKNPVHISRSKIMKAAKIKGLATYHKCIKDFQSLGYIKYRPSYHPKLASEVFIDLSIFESNDKILHNS